MCAAVRGLVVGPPTQNSVTCPTPVGASVAPIISARAPHSRTSVASSTSAATSPRCTLFSRCDDACRPTTSRQLTPAASPKNARSRASRR